MFIFVFSSQICVDFVENHLSPGLSFKHNKLYCGTMELLQTEGIFRNIS